MVILCVEDDLGMLHYILRLLKADGHRVLAAGDGEAALKVSRSFSGCIDLLVSDVEMPQMNGLELRRIILAERPNIRTLMMSGAFEGREKVSMLGLPFLQKPFYVEALRDAVEAVLGPKTL